MMDWRAIAVWAKEKSTIVGVVSAVTVVSGWAIAPDKIEAIATLTTVAASAVAMVMREK